MSIASNKTYHS